MLATSTAGAGPGALHEPHPKEPVFRLIDRYVFKEIAAASLLGLLVYTSIFIVNNFFKLADPWVKGTLSLTDVFRLLVYYVPSVLTMTIPMSVLLGVLIGFSRLSADSEITALRTTGISYFRLLKPTLLLVFLAWALTSAVYLRVVPWANTSASDLQAAAARRVDLNREIRPGTWTPLAEGVPGQDGAILARGVDNSDPDAPWLTHADIIIIDRTAGEARHYQADRVRIERVVTGEETGRFKFVFRGLRTILWKPDAKGEPPRISEATSGEHVLAERRMVGSRPPANQRRHDKGVRNMTLDELRGLLRDLSEMDRIDQVKRSDPAAAARMQAGSKVPLVSAVRERIRILAQMEIHKKFAIPLACLVFGLAGMPLGISTRRGGRPASFAISIAVVALWWIIHNAGTTWALAKRLSPAAGAWLPDIVIGVVAVHALIVQRKQQAVGSYRALRDGSLLAALVLAMLTGVFLWERHAASVAGAAAPPIPAWAPVGTLALFLVHGLLLAFRDRLSRILADLSEAFRRPRAAVPEEPEAHSDEAPLVDRPLLEAVPEPSAAAATSPAEERRWMRRGRLEKLRGAIVFGFLAMIVFGVVEAFQHEDGPMAGARALMSSWEPIALALLGLACIGLQVAGVRIISTMDWWIVSGLLRAFSLVLGSMVVIYAVFEYLALADNVLQNDVAVATLLEYFLNVVPRMLTDLLPYAGMLAVLVTFGIMAKFNETTAVRCGGVSVYRAVMPAVLLGALLSSGAFVLHDYVLPRSNQRADDLRREMQGQPPQRRASTRGFITGSNGHSLYQFRQVVAHESAGNVQAQIQGLTILGQGTEDRVQDLWNATDAMWSNDHWVLRNGWHAVIDSSNQVRVETFEQRPLPGLERPEYFAAIRRNPDQMPFAEFSRYVDEQAAAGYPTAALRVGLQEKLAFPAATLVLILVGLPFAFTTGRRGALYGVGIALILAVLHLASVAFFTALGSAEYLPPMAAAWAPNALFGMTGIYLLLHVRT